MYTIIEDKKWGKKRKKVENLTKKLNKKVENLAKKLNKKLEVKQWKTVGNPTIIIIVYLAQ